ncbi:sulfonate ABC transporter ATP-binding protein [Companilactobacillus crustorum]|uniref:ABC-type nitrate sulfonate bicarbonate transport system, ATPase component n=3 Tax=Companilactobacillus TaxID=2767879 RepID=A0A837RK86_9LACO|nr:ABC transporter ATP-binding protein [Companilactobacillus crustorum]APU72260.1 Aliphatic sulfonates import ATP-binding protein SsuB [Companilactobacillus crustorum]KRK44579.1 ABC-type nitrate sulfonate bicarbonate transport system, ATPase component [Companilactobacillus crustorum JCM 15951]KRO21769.1 ABC-type nitrate sulfonate bicarbonate transport system, ATPase component [Companilactobacillus crustorum]WDT65686.1 ABC transporter ATP-binding protein [Companilactobacillus crustorum]GEO77306
MNTNSMIKIKNVNKTYDNLTALQNINLDINQGEFIALVGMSGGGKSTLLRLIAGLEQPTTGSVSIESDHTKSLMRVMFQEDRLLPWMSVLDNLSFGSKDKNTKAHAQELLELVELGDYADQFPNQLSGGQKQRVALARALMSHPQILLLDEPLGALDALTRRKMQDLILDICQKQNLTTILVTHDVEEAARMADRIIVMKNSTNTYEEVCPKNRNAGQIGIVADRVLGEILEEPNIEKQTA